MTQFSAQTEEMLHVDEISLWWGHSVEAAKVETKGQKTHIYMEEITCHFIMLYLIPLNNMYAYKHPNTKNNRT